MKWRFKLAIVGLLLGSIGPFIMCSYYFVSKNPAGSELVLLFPLSIFLMEAETLSTLASIALYLLLSGLNLAIFGGTGLLIGWIIEKLKAH